MLVKLQTAICNVAVLYTERYDAEDEFLPYVASFVGIMASLVMDLPREARNDKVRRPHTTAMRTKESMPHFPAHRSAHTARSLALAAGGLGDRAAQQSVAQLHGEQVDLPQPRVAAHHLQEDHRPERRVQTVGCVERTDLCAA